MSHPDHFELFGLPARFAIDLEALEHIYDMLAAKNAGIPSIAVSFGFLYQPIEELGADAVIDSYEELIPTLERLAR